MTNSEAPIPPNLVIDETATASARDFDISDPELLRMLQHSERTHFWFRARNAQILDFFSREGIVPPARILEVGCGSGTVLSALAAAGFETCGLEMHPELARRAANAAPSATIFSANVFAPPNELLARGPFQAVGFFDVLEHLDRPDRVLRACARLLAPGGRLVGTLPALSALWSDYDSFAGHRLRYDREELSSLFRRSALPEPRADYFFQALLPAMLVRRALVGRGRGGAPEGDEERRRRAQHRALDAPGPLANGLLAAACAAERALRRVAPIGRLPGASLWFSSRVEAPELVSGESPSTARTGGTR